MNSQERRVVITGLALHTAAGTSLEAHASSWWEGHSHFSTIDSYSTEGTSVRFAAQCPTPDLSRLPDKKVRKILTKKDLISLVTTIAAAEHAGVTAGTVDPERFGMYVGAGSTQIGDLTPYFELVKSCVSDGVFDSARFGRDLLSLVNPMAVLTTLMNNGLCFGAISLDIRGVNGNFMDFQVSGLRAVGEAFRALTAGRADIVIAGGVASPVEPFHVGSGVRIGYLARTGDDGVAAEQVVRPYDLTREGTILGEGAAYLVLEEETHARSRGAPILGRIHGYGQAADGAFTFMQETHAPGLVRAMRQALDDAGESAENLGMIVGHGNGVRGADQAEASALVELLGKSVGRVPVTSPKGVLGELSEPAGVVSIALALDALGRRSVPPTFNYRQGDAVTAQLALSDAPQELNGTLAAVTARSFLGLASCLVVSLA